MTILNDNYWEAAIPISAEWWLSYLDPNAFQQLTSWTSTISPDDWHYSSTSGIMHFRYAIDASAFRIRFGL